MLIAIDHGNYAVKTPHFSFISGLTEHTVKPPMAEEVLEYNGKYWSLTGQRLPYMRDKTRDDRYLSCRYLPLLRSFPLPVPIRRLSRSTLRLACRRNTTGC